MSLSQRYQIWQPPAEGLSASEVQTFWSKVRKERDDQHWVWTGWLNARYPAMQLAGRAVNAVRVAYAVKYPRSFVPKKFSPSCSVQYCVNPDHYDYVKPEQAAPAEAPAVHIHEGNVPLEDGPEPLPGMTRTLEAYAHLQFGLPVTPRPLFRREVPPKEEIKTPEGETTVTPPVGMVAYQPTRLDYRDFAAMSKEEIMDLIFQPDTVVMTFRTGHVWFSNGHFRVDAPDGPSALTGAQTLMGRRRVQG